jgi:hypothetical protein
MKKLSIYQQIVKAIDDRYCVKLVQRFLSENDITGYQNHHSSHLYPTGVPGLQLQIHSDRVPEVPGYHIAIYARYRTSRVMKRPIHLVEFDLTYQDICKEGLHHALLAKLRLYKSEIQGIIASTLKEDIDFMSCNLRGFYTLR